MINISLNCVKCDRCTEVCPSKKFERDGDSIRINANKCIKCGHCVYSCPVNALEHDFFREKDLIEVDYSNYPSSEQLYELMRARRTNRAFLDKEIPTEKLDLIMKSALLAPTASNLRGVKLILVTDIARINKIVDYTVDSFSKTLSLLNNPIIKPIVKIFASNLYSYLPNLKKIVNERKLGKDPILRGSKCLILFYSPAKTRFGRQDSNLAYQNASLMAESMGISQMYTGFLCSVIDRDRKKKINELLSIEGQVHAGMALGLPKFRYMRVRQ